MVFIGLQSPLTAQVELSYNGIYQIDEYKGNAQFEFYIQDNDTILNGAFRMASASLKQLLSARDNSFSFQGNFKKNIPSGQWLLKFGNYSVGDSIDVIDNIYQVSVSGTQHHAEGQLAAGKLNGKWVHKVEQLDNSNVERKLFESTITFDKGVPQRSFRIENTNYVIVGRFLRDGHAHDHWELYPTDDQGVAESWFFADGRLKKIVLKESGREDTLSVFISELSNPELTNLDDRYLKIINLRNQIYHQSKGNWESKMKPLLDTNAEYYEKINSIISSLGDSDFTPEFKVKLERYPLTESEKGYLNEIERYYQKSVGISSQLLESTQLNILKLANNEVLFLLSVLTQLDNENISFLKRINEFNEENILEFIPRDSILPTLASINKQITVRLEDQDSLLSRVWEGPRADEFQDFEGGLKAALAVAEYTYLSADSIKNALNSKLKTEEREQALMELEEQLIAKYTSLNNSLDSLNANTSGKPGKALNRIKAAAKSKLSDYSAREGLEGKADDARGLIRCFTQMALLSVSIADLPSKWKQIEETYTDEVWNPFTSTVMDEDLKVHITDAYKDVLVPYIFEMADEDLLCDQVGALNALIAKTHVRMFAMIDEDTSKIERKLRRENDPVIVLELFGISNDLMDTQ